MRIAFAVSLVAVVACAEKEPGDGSHARLELSGGSGPLILSGTALDPDYEGTYDNPRGIAYMKVTIGPRGKLTGVCRTHLGLTPCGDVPFFSRIETTALGRSIKAWDLHGTLVASFSCADLDDEICGAAAYEEQTASAECDWDEPSGDGAGDGEPSDDGCGGGDCGDGGDMDGGDTGGGDTGGGDTGGDSPTSDCSTAPSDCVAAEDWARDCFCQGVNQAIEDAGIDHTIDCDSLDSDTDYSKGDDGGYDGPIACRADLINDTEHEVEGEIKQTECDEVRDSLHNWSSQVDYELRTGGMCGHSPLILDLAGDGIALTDLAGGARFDLLGTGAPVNCSWIAGDDAFLALDRDGSGTIDSGTELFGNATAAGHFDDGFAALAELDGNDNGRIDAADPMFGALRVWSDQDRDAIGSSDELRTLDEVGVATLSLAAERVTGRAAWDGRGNRIPLTSLFTRADGSDSALVDAFLRYAPDPVASAPALTCEARD